MISRKFIKSDNPFQNCLRRKNACTGHFSISQFSFKNLKESLVLHHKHFSSHIVLSPFPKSDFPKILIPELILDIADRFPEATALKCGLSGRSYKFSELQILSQRFMNSLIKAGFSHKDVIAVVLSNCPESAIVMLGALQADMTVTLMNHTYTPDEMYHQFKDSGSVCVVSGVDQLPVVQATIAKLEQTTRSNPIKKIIAMDIPSTSLPEGVARFSEAIADHVDHSRKTTNKSTVNDLAFMPYSSGTTGLAKGVCLSHSNIVSAINQIPLSGITVNGPDGDQDTLLGLLPFFHIYGLLILLNSVNQGGQIITMPRFQPESFIRILESEKLSMLFLAPPLVLFLGIHPLINKKKHLVNAKLVVTGADITETSTMERLKTKLPLECNLGNGYGLTESTGIATFPIFPVKNFFTCGVPAALTQAKICCQETGRNLGPHQTGELCFRGPQVMVGYKNNPAATAEMIDDEGWLHTGDIGYFDEDNYFYIEGRLKELIKVKGFQVPPAELEAVLRTHPGIGDVAVIGVPDPKTGETPVAYVVRAKGPEGKGVPLSEEQVKQFLSEKVTKHKQVSQVFFVNSIPKSTSGKILRKELLEWFQDGRG